MSYPAYPEYKDSGVEWLGEVPAHWGVSPFKWQIDANDGGAWGVDPTGENDTYVLRSTDQTVDGHWKITEPALRYLSINERFATVLKAGDLVITKSSGSSLHIGKTTIVDDLMALKGFSFGNFMQRIRTKNSFSSRLAWYFMNNRVARLQLDLLSNSTTGLANLNGTILGEILAATPPREEQADIVTFLDHETARIDALVEEQQRLISLLKEKRQAVISHAVTKGLDPDVPMKDSGVEWLGEVPEHWDVVPLGLLAHQIQTGPFGSQLHSDEYIEGGVPVINPSNIIDGIIRPDQSSTVTQGVVERMVHQQLSEGEIVVGRRGEMGRCAVVSAKEDGWLCGTGSMKIALSELVDPEFIVLFIRTPLIRGLLQIESVGSTMDNLNPEILSRIRVPVPPTDEQHDLVQKVRLAEAKSSSLIKEALHGSKLLQERRSALISAAVTGKIDVRGWKPPTDSVVSTEAKPMEAV